MRRFWLIFCLLVWPGIAYSENIADRVADHYAQLGTIRADFIQNTYVDILDSMQTRQGKLYLAPNKFRIEYREPEEQLYIFNGETLWIYSPPHQEVEIYTDAESRISREALTFLNGLATLQTTFRIPKAVTRKEEVALTLIPRDKTSRLKKIEIVVAKDNLDLKEATIWPKQGNRSQYSFSNLETRMIIPDTKFNLRVPKKVRIIRNNL